MRLALMLVALAACGESSRVIGDVRWDVGLADGSNSALTSVAFDGNDVVVAGWQRAAGTATAFLRRLDAAGGTETWTVPLSGAYTWVSKIDVDPDGNIAVCGVFQGAADFGGTVLDQPPGVTGETVFVASYDARGGLRWVRVLTTEGGGEPLDLAVGRDGSIAVTGWFAGTLGESTAQDGDAFVAELDVDGSLLWSFSVAAPDRQYGEGIAVAPDGDVVAGLEPAAVRVSPDGEALWTTPFPPSGPKAIAVENRGDIVLAGLTDAGKPHLVTLDQDGSEISGFAHVPAEMGRAALAIGVNDTILVGGNGLVAFGADGALIDGRPVDDGAIVDLAVAHDAAIAFASRTSVTVLDAP